MGELPAQARTVFTALIAFQVAALAARLPSCTARAELVRFAVFLVLLGFRLVVPAGSPLFSGISVCIIWAAGEHLAALLEHPLRRAWFIANAAFLAILLFASFLQFGPTLPFAAFYSFFSGVLLLYPIALLAGVARRSRRVIHALLLASGALSFVAGAAEAVFSILGRPFADFGAWTVCIISLCTGYLVFHEGYLQKSGQGGFLAH
jgi:hypothetical protein